MTSITPGAAGPPLFEDYTEAYATGGAGAVEIVAPSANTVGITVIFAAATTNATTALHSILAKASAPASIGDGLVLIAGAGTTPMMHYASAVKVPAGLGLYGWGADTSARSYRVWWK